MTEHVKTIGIIGAGVSGLIAAKTFLEEGFDCEVFERNKSLGGVWENGYHLLHLQLPKESYEFLDWPMPSSYPRYPSCDQILAYLNSYARHFRIFSRIRFNCCVEKLEPRTEGHGWQLNYLDKSDNTENSKEFDFIVVCNGLYSTPLVPSYPNQDQFEGRVLHSSLFRDPELAEGRRVVVVGFGKSALDTAENTAQLSDEVTLVFRQAHWPLPRKILGIFDVKYISSRFISAMLPLYQHPGKWERHLHRYAGSLVWLFWRTMEIILRLQFRLKRCGVLPLARIEPDMFTGDFIASPKLYPLLKQGRIRTQQTTIKQFTHDGVDLANGVHVKADTVVFGTGWKNDQSFLPDVHQSILENDGSYLYRHIIHPLIPSLGFIGLASTFNNSLSDYLEARWLVDVLKGDIALPDEAYQLQEIEQMKRWKRSIMPAQSARGSLLQLHVLHYHDELLRDMHINYKRKRNFIAELFGAYQPADYKDILKVNPGKLDFAKHFTVREDVRYFKQEKKPQQDEEKSAYQAIIDNLPDVGSHGLSLAPVDLRACNLSGADLSQKNLKAADLRRARLMRTNLNGANLQGADISGANLKDAELINTNLLNAKLSRVNFERAFLIDSNLSGAYLSCANLTSAHLSGAQMCKASLNNAQLGNADLSGANLVGADLREADLTNCDLSNCNLEGANLSGANLSGAILLSADFEGANITGVKFNETESCKDIRINSAFGNALLKRFAQDQAYIEEYKIHRPARYMLWKYSSNCGRSLSLWVLWCFFLVLGFAMVFHFHLGGSESFLLTELAKDPDYDPQSLAPMLYYSVVTFTTLGFGDIVPKTQLAAWWIMAEVVMGYFMLGGLITILATKLARRS
jgi:dimethylaniline monooxygenase (N-oxide forming)